MFQVRSMIEEADLDGDGRINFSEFQRLMQSQAQRMQQILGEMLELSRLESAGKAKVPMPIGAAARESASLARAAGWGGRDFSAMSDFWCGMAGVEKARLKGY